MKILILSVCFLGGCLVQGLASEDLEKKLVSETQIREEKIRPLVEAVREGEQLVSQGEVSRACDQLSRALGDTPESLRSSPVGLAAYASLSRWESRMAATEAGLSHWVKAREWALRALQHDPKNPDAQSLLAECEKMLGRGSVSGDPVNPALTDRFFDKLQGVKTGLQEAEQLRETGQLREAEARFEQVLKLDPFNEVAMDGIQKISKEKLLAGDKARDVANLERRREVREAWNNIYPKKDEARSGAKIVGPMTLSPVVQLEQKMKEIVIPQIEFTGLDLETVRRALVTLSRQYDKDNRGVNFVVSTEVSSPQPVNLKLRDVSLLEVVRYVAQIAGVKTRLSEIGVTFAPIVETRPDLISREFTVSPSFFKGTAGSSGAESSVSAPRGAVGGIDAVAAGGTGQNEQAKLEELGVKFPQGAFAVYNRSTSRLRVVNNAEMLDLISQLIAAAEEETYLIQVGVRLVEINQVDLDSITVNSSFGSTTALNGIIPISAIPAGLQPSGNGSTPAPSVNQGVSAQMNQIQGVGMLPNNTLQSFLQPGVLAGTNQTSSYALNTLQLGGSIMGGMQFRALLTAISQKSSANVLASPTITLKRGQEGVIDVTQDFRYVKEYNDPQSSIATVFPPNVAGGGIVDTVPGPETVIGSFPSQISDVVPIGVKLGVKPDIAGENNRVLMELKPSFLDFEGFINYGALVQSAYTARYFGQSVTILTNNIQQPVFVRRDVNLPAVEVSDGYTLMLGGLLREDIQKIDEKVPIIGDMPILGRAFQGKTEQAIKKNTLIFVTPRILQVDGQYLNPTAGMMTTAASSGSSP